MGRYSIDDFIMDDDNIRVTQDDLWFVVNDANETSYSPYKVSKRIAEHTGEGDRIPTPAEAVAYLKQFPEADLDGTGLYFERRAFNETDSSGVVLPAGVYKYAENAGGRLPERLVKIDLRGDHFVTLGGCFKSVDVDISTFMNNRQVYEDHGMIYKMGLLLWGPPGNGKSSIIRKILKELVPQDAIIVFVEEKFPSSFFLHKIQSSLRNRLKVFVFEELATTLDHNYNMARILDFLDGETSPESCIVLATTNYPDKIPGNMVNRPSRFDKLYNFDFPNAAERRTLLEHFLKRETTKEEVDLTKDLSIADLKEVALEMLLKQTDFSVAVGTLKRRAELCRKRFAETKSGLGF